jgi:tetratricopeptide (TPR) repeat protein
MTTTISNKTHWQKIFFQQKLANAQYWLSLIEENNDPAQLIATDYENVLLALEATLQRQDTFDLAYKLIQSIYPIAIDYADWNRWLIYLDNALQFSYDLNKLEEHAKLLIQIGDINYRMAEIKKAEYLYERAIEEFKSIDNLAGYANVLTKLAVLYAHQGQVQKGIEFCQQALNIANQLNNSELIAQVNLYFSHIYYRSRDWDQALKTAQRAYKHYSANGPPRMARKTLMNIIATWAEIENWEEVNKVSKNLENELILFGDIRTLSQLKNNLGVVAFNQENYATAEGYWQEALKLHSQIQEPIEQASLYNNLGVVYTLMNEWQAAKDMLNKAVAAHQQLGDVYNWANSLDNLADLYEEMGKMDQCRKILEEAWSGLSKMADSQHAQELLNSISKRLSSLPGS